MSHTASPFPEYIRTVGIFAPAKAVPTEDFHKALEKLCAGGVTAKYTCLDFQPSRYFAGTDDERLEGLQQLIDDPEIDLLLAARGGFGTARLLEKIDWEALRRKNIPVVGYSDLTAFHLAALKAGCRRLIQGPMLCPQWGDSCPADAFSAAMESLHNCLDGCKNLLPTWHQAEILVPGTAEGPLVPCNLTVLCSLIGTDFLPDLTGSILVLEDIHEPAHAIDRALLQLRQTGILKGLTGLIFGQFTQCEDEEFLPEILKEFAEDISGPVLKNLAFGHQNPSLSLPVGKMVSLQAESPQRISLTLCEGSSVLQDIPAEALEILHCLKAAGHKACLAGGCVRDFLLHQPPHDWDIATSARPDEIETLFPRTIAIGKAFGIITVIQNETPYEIATFRNDGEYEDGRHPTGVTFSSMEEDVKRRDFTVNALLYDPLEQHLYDFVGGQKDLQRRILRAVGVPFRRFAEDKLRILRAIRFAANLQFTIEAETWQAICKEAPNIKKVSCERIAAELEKMLLGGCAWRALQLLQQSGLLKILLPKVAAMQYVRQPPQFHPEGDVWEHTLLMLKELDRVFRHCTDNEEAPRFTNGGILARASAREKRILAWATLLHDVGKPGTFIITDRIRFNGHDALGAVLAEEILRNLRLPNDIIEGAVELVRRHMSLVSFREMKVATKRRKLQAPIFPLLLELHRLDCFSSHRLFDLHGEIFHAWLEEQARPLPPTPLISGQDLIRLGMKPGPIFAQILKAVQDATLENAVATKEEALRWIATRFSDHIPQ